MRKKLGIACMSVGAFLLICALGLLVWNFTEANRAEMFSTQAVSELKEVIVKDTQPQNSPAETDLSTADNQMKELEIDGYEYIGYLSVPTQNLELPVMSQWDYDRLQISPCRFSGNIAEENLVIIAHNYSSHFGNLDRLELNEKILFTDTDGNVIAYKVATVDVVPPESAEEVTAGNFDLALVTCTYSGKTRFVVYCNEIKNSQ